MIGLRARFRTLGLRCESKIARVEIGGGPAHTENMKE
jgi:hypothetical protein